ncbi:hypothetical protein PRUPE_5G053900 [Prunus persica]|uniref:Uncharacterized protein n=1 Tax=Prunus persica TaxID=3760 RepID=A0A251P465_PRUPE|nr:uncharacterized protein LOC18777347 [Prunus persica]ONI06331.1 hypothetical protein PRUPE_5G053900 [Prunus persica]
MKGKMEGDFQFGSNSNSLDLLSEVAVVVKNWEEEDVEKAMSMAVRSRCNPLQGFGFDGYLVPDRATIKITSRVRVSSSSSSSSALDMLLQVTSNELMELEKANTFSCICIPKKKRTSLRRGRTMLTSFPCSSHDSIPLHQIPRKKRSNLRRTKRAFLPDFSHDSTVQVIKKAMQELERVLAEKGTVDFTLFPLNDICIPKKKAAKVNAMELCSFRLNSPSCSSTSCISQDC